LYLYTLISSDTSALIPNYIKSKRLNSDPEEISYLSNYASILESMY